MGSPEFALPTLRLLVENYPVVGVVTQPDKPAGRGRKISPPPVKNLALNLNLPVIQPHRLKNEETMEQLRAWNPDLIVVAAFGQILKPDLLELPPYGCLNVHASLLPRWRGAAPVQAAILHGDHVTGVTIMKMDPGVDTGPILSRQSTPIDLEETAGELSQKLAHMGAKLLIESLPAYFSGQLNPQPQDDEQATYAPILKKGEGELDFTQPAEDLARKVRAFNPWPGAFTYWRGKMIKIHHARAIEDWSRQNASDIKTGSRIIHDHSPAIIASRGILVLDEVQLAGKKSVPGREFLHGARDWTSPQS